MNDESIPISALQHWLFCPRQCSLIHVERLWAENRLTAEGRVLHERADAGIPESRDSMRILRAVQIASEQLGVHGIADVVEMHNNVPLPVEYKRGNPKKHRADEVQLCAQALCLQEMTGHHIDEGKLFYGGKRRRFAVTFDDELRSLTLRVIDEVKQAVRAGFLPPSDYEPSRCDACSLKNLCRPNSPAVAQGWMRRHLPRRVVPE